MYPHMVIAPQPAMPPELVTTCRRWATHPAAALDGTTWSSPCLALLEHLIELGHQRGCHALLGSLAPAVAWRMVTPLTARDALLLVTLAARQLRDGKPTVTGLRRFALLVLRLHALCVCAGGNCGDLGHLRFDPPARVELDRWLLRQRSKGLERLRSCSQVPLPGLDQTTAPSSGKPRPRRPHPPRKLVIGHEQLSLL